MKASRINISASNFKTNCLKLLDQVSRTGEIIVVTKRGRPVAKVCPIEQTAPGSLRKSVKYNSDITLPTEELWEAENDNT